MAIKPIDDVINTDAPTVAYPGGQARDVVVAGDNTGTPFNAVVLNDLWGLLQSILDSGSVLANGSPDSVSNPQYLAALGNIFASIAALNAVISDVGDTVTALGNSNDTNMGNYTGGIISPGNPAKVNIQDLETLLALVVTALGNLQTALGSSLANMGSFSGSILTDNTSTKVLLQELSDAVEAVIGTIVNANTTTKGIVEQSVTSELFVLGGSPAITGSTGAALFMTPRDIANSKLSVGRAISTFTGFYYETLIQSSSQLLIQRGESADIVFGSGGGSVGSVAFTFVNFPIVYFSILGITIAVTASTSTAGASSSIISPSPSGFNFRGVKTYGTNALSNACHYTAFGKANAP